MRRFKRITMSSPMEIKVLSDFVESWEQVTGGKIVRVKNAPFDEMFITSRFIAFFERKMSFSCPIEIVPGGQMDKTKVIAYRLLKGLECELEYKSPFMRNPQFKHHRLLFKLKKMIPSLRISSDLIDAIHKNEDLMDIIKRIKPDEINVLLVSMMPEALAITLAHRHSENVLRAMAFFYREPTTITWSLVISKMVPRTFHYGRNIRGMFDILRLIAPIVLETSEKYLNLAEEIRKKILRAKARSLWS